MRLANRIDRLEAMEAQRRERARHAARSAIADSFAEGDPRLDESFADLTQDRQIAVVWAYEAWCVDRAGFIAGTLSEECRPTAAQLPALERTLWREP
jgi:hypothetical protein